MMLADTCMNEICASCRYCCYCCLAALLILFNRKEIEFLIKEGRQDKDEDEECARQSRNIKGGM